MIKKVLMAVAVIIVLFVIVVATRPGDFRVTRSARIAAPAEVVFPHVNDLHNWEAWSPWAKRDPNAKNTYEGPDAGVGAALAWSGNQEVGEGRMTITESRLNEVVRFQLDFVKPFESTCETEFSFKPEGGQTAVTWSMSGKNNFLGKAISLFMNCDKMIGDDFEQGFANLKSVVETPRNPGL